jgi:hypothetical protein
MQQNSIEVRQKTRPGLWLSVTLFGLVLLVCTVLVSGTHALDQIMLVAAASNDQFTTSRSLYLEHAQQAASPRITSPQDGQAYVFGAPIPFSAVDDAHICADDAYTMTWMFEKVGDVGWHTYNFTPTRMLDYAGGTHLMPLPGAYGAKVRMCGVESPPIQFIVDYTTPVTGQHHPEFASQGIISPCIDWDDEDGSDNHRTSAHFNIYWNTFGQTCDGKNTPVTSRPPTDEEIGLLECTYATLARWMTAPLDQDSIYRNVAGYDVLTHIPVYMGLAGGGGGGIPQGLFFGVGVDNRIFAHELFHVFDYAGNPLHLRAFDWRYENNAYHFYHESVTRIQQTMAKDSTVLWGYRTDTWPVWAPLDLGLLELDYDAGPFWAFLMDFYGDDFAVGPRETWEGPDIDACQQQVELNPQGNAYRPHNFKFFEAWNAQVRSEVQGVMGEGANLVDYPGEAFCDWRHNVPDSSFLYVGQTDPPCLQTLEYEMQVLEDLIRGRVDEEGTPLEESLMLDFAVQFAKAFPPNSLAQNIPQAMSCSGQSSLTFAKGFEVIGTNCPTDTVHGVPPVIAPAPVCQAVADVNSHDFYARIQFRIKEENARYLRLRANDDATLYMNGLAVIGEEVEGDPSAEDYPNASTTYADQRYEWANNHAPLSSIFPIGDPRDKTFEIEWVNRGDTRGNIDGNDACSQDHSRYLLMLEWSSQPVSSTFQTLGDDKVEIISSQFWPNQGSGYPGFSIPLGATAIPKYSSYTSPITREIQLRPVAWLKRPFLLPSLGVNYHPVQCPADYVGDLEVVVRDDHLLLPLHSVPSVHMLTLEDENQVEWWGELDRPNPLTHRAVLTCDGTGGPAKRNGRSAIILVTSRLTPHGEDASTMGAVHYTVFVKELLSGHIHLPLILKNARAVGPTPTPLPTPTRRPPLPSPPPQP